MHTTRKPPAASPADFAPGPELQRRVRQGIINNGARSYAAWCREHGVRRTTANFALLGQRNGPMARALRARLIEAAGLADR
jgi:hypothetical protein